MNAWPNVVAFAFVLFASCVAGASAQQSPATIQVGWLGLFNQSLVSWLENENQLQPLCSAFAPEGAEWQKCRAEKLAPKIHVTPLRSGPSDEAASAGSLLVVATPGQGLRAFFVPSKGGLATEFRPDLFDGDWGYGPYFHQTFLERRATWFRLPEGPLPKGTWINATQLGDGEETTRGNPAGPELELLEAEDIVSTPFGDLFILGIEGGVVRARLEQDADMWCKDGTPPPLKPSQERRIPLSDLYTPAGHLLLHIKYTRGC
jgi:hypothetical protein